MEETGKTDNDTARDSICHSKYTENRQQNRRRQYLSQQTHRKQTTKQAVTVSARGKARKTDNDTTRFSICHSRYSKNRQQNRL
ncbi:MAG: hypothetical protein Q4F98_06095 [Lachnospiraceae bacterium]|nr:hypothetical protein [Lachnospiraceae bacterium]